MVPTTLEGCVPVSEAGGARGGSISLAMLIDFIVQRTYHELTVLADLLPRKTDMERKVEIYKLSARTRQLFVRLLALVKWAGSASKVDRSAQIMGFLDKQALLFVDTADMLARMARETLVHARLPTFHIPAAVEVLTQGTYARLPVCIRDRLVPPSGLTVAERRTTLRALNHVIRQRLVTCALPDNMRTFKVENGRVTFQVGQEFSVSLTVMGDSPNLPWRLLDVAILVQDSEIGEGKPLVHPRQVSYIRGVAQAHLAGGGGGGGLRALLAVLGYFCRSLQLELLYTQTLRLARDRLGQHLRVHQYVPGRRLTISYWRELGCELGYRVSVQADSSSPGRPLSACHVPQLGPEQEAAAARALHGPRLSVEHLLATTIHVRSKARLQDLKALLTDMGVECTLGGSPCVLACCVLWPCLRAEQLLVAVGVHCGSLRCHVPQHPHAPAPALPQALAAGDRAKLKPLLADLRFWLMARRCEKTLQHLPAQATERLPLITPPNHPLTKLSPHRLYVTLHRHANHILVVEMIPDGPGGVKLCFHLSRVKRCGPEEEDTDSDQGGAFLRVQSLVQFDTFVLTHGPFTPVDAPGGGGKRKALVAGRSVRSKQPAYFLPELAHVVAAADERIPFVYLAQELSMKGVCHGGLQVEPCGGPALRLVSLPCPWGEGEGAGRALLRRLLSASVRVMPRNQARVWTAEFVFHSSPIRSASPKEQGMRRCVYFQYEMCAEGAARNTEGAARAVDALMQDWNMVVRLHDLVHHYSQRDHAEREAAEAHVSIVSYDYRRLVLGAGPGGLARCAVTWAGGRLRLRPAAAPGAVNAHALIHHQLEDFLNRSKDLLQLMAALKETYAPLVALGRLPSTPHLGLQQSRPQVPVQAFTLVPQSWRKIRVAYQGAYCLEVAVRGGGVVAIRDGAYSRFDRSAVVGEFTPTQGLKSFLSLYVSESTSRVVSEDDNPPSPVSPREGGGLRFPAPLTPPAPHTPHSQPHTPHPASPHQGHGSSFNLTSPPMLGGAHVSPASPQHPGASPLSQHMPTHSSPTQPYMPGSPFTWPGSPSVPRPSPARSQEHKVVAGPGRVLVGGRAWAGAVATPLPVSALEALCLPCEAPSGAPSPPMPPLERFLGAVYMRRHLQRFIQQPQQDSTLTLVACPEPGVVMFRAEDCGLTGRVALHPAHMQSLQLTLAPLPDHKDQWTTEELQVIEKYFEQRVVCPPYKPNSVWGWGRAWGAPAGVLRDLVQLMRHELGAGPGAPQAWELQWALRIPPQAVPHIIPTAQPAVLLARNKILLFLSLSRHDCEVVLPLVHDFSTNVTQLAEKREPGAHHAPTSLQHQALIILKRFADYNTVLDQCSLWLAIRDLLANLQVPSDFIRNSQMNVMGDINARR